MASTFKPWETPTEYGVHYHFDKAGEGIPLHSHVNRSQWHYTRCLKGACEIYGDGVDAVLGAGEQLAFKSYRLHELRALEDGTEIVNVFIHGKPPGYAEAPEAALSGSSAPVLTGRQEFD